MAEQDQLVAAAMAHSGAKAEPYNNGHANVMKTAAEKPISPISPAHFPEKAAVGLAVHNQRDSGSLNTGSATEVGIGILANAGTVTADTITNAGITSTNVVSYEGNIANRSNGADKEPLENEGKPRDALHGLESASRSDEADGDPGIQKEQAEEELLPPEEETVQVPHHWHFKPSVHVLSIGGHVNEEELLSLFGAYGQISSISFQNERRDSAIIRYDFSAGTADELVVQVRGALNNTKLGDRTLIVEPFRPDSLLFVGNLTPNIDDALLTKMFEPHGRVERAFVLRNAEGHSKCYGFVEYSLKGQAFAAKLTMGNINMEGRVLRVEWSDCRRVADMFSAILFIDRMPRENPNVEQSLRNLFGQYGKVRDCYLAPGIHQQFRGLAFIEFYHSVFADRAYHALDGHELEGANIRVSFANPSKSVQSYKMRSGSSPAQPGLGPFGKGALDHSLQPVVPGMLMGPLLKGPMAMPYLASRFMGSARPGMLGMGIGMQFGRGTLDRGLVPPILGSGAGMLGPGSVAAGMMNRAPLMVGNMASRPRMAVGGNIPQVGGPGFQSAQGSASIASTAVAQVADVQAKAREEEARARAEALKQGLQKAASEQHATNQFRFNTTQQNIYQQHTSASTDQQCKQGDSSLYHYQQVYQQPSQQQTTLQAQHQAWTQHQQAQAYGSQYYMQPTQSNTQQQQTTQYVQQDGYHQQSTQQAEATGTQQQYAYAQQYATQYGQQYNQQIPQSYGQTYSQAAQSTEQYKQPFEQQPQTTYQQQNHVDQHSLQPTQDQTHPVVSATETNTTGTGPVSQDSSQQQAYAAYYQQQAQVQSGTAAATASATDNQQQSYEAQWAAYYANQAAYQQANYGQQQSYTGTTGAAASFSEQTSMPDAAGHKRTADQMESALQTQAAYNYGQAVPAASGYTQQVVTGTATYQQQPTGTLTAYQQQAAAAMASYQQPSTALPYQQPATGGAGYHQPTASNPTTGYDQTASVTDGYQQQPTAATGTFQTAVQGQAAIAGMYDYNKRPRY